MIFYNALFALNLIKNKSST